MRLTLARCRGMPVGVSVGGMPGGGGWMAPPGPGGEEAWLDGVITQIMEQYEPPSQAASHRAVRNLPLLAVRGKDAAGEPGEGQAVARAGEPCSVW